MTTSQNSKGKIMIKQNPIREKAMKITLRIRKAVEMIEKVIDRMMNREINPLQAVNQIDIAIGGVTAITYRRGLTIQNHSTRESVNTNGYSKKELKLLDELAAILYIRAQQNGSIKPGEVHLDKGLSTKHYAKAFREYAGGLVARYSAN